MVKMPPKSQPKSGNITKQANKKATPDKFDDFISVARRLEADEDKGRFEAKLAKIAKVKAKS